MRRRLIILSILFITWHQNTFCQKNYSDYNYKKTGTLFYEDFESGNIHGWPTWSNSDYTSEIKEGYFLIKSNASDYLPTEAINENEQFFKIDQNTDYQIEAEIKYISGQNNNANVMGFGRATEKSNSGFYSQYRFCFSGDGSVRIDDYDASDRSFTQLLSWQKSSALKPHGSYNKLTVRKVGGKMFFFVNEVLIYESDALPLYGNDLSFQPNYESEIHVTNIIIGEISKKSTEQILSLSELKPQSDLAQKYRNYQTSEVIFKEDFSDNDYGWYEGVIAGERSYSITNGYFEIQSFNDRNATGTFNINKAFNIDENRDFQIESKIKYVNGEDNNLNALTWGGSYDDFSNFRFGFTGTGSFEVIKYDGVKKEFVPLIGWTKCIEIKKGQYMKLTVRKVKEQYYFFINETLVGTAPFEPFYGQKLGLSANSGTKINCDDVLISYINTDGSKQEETKIIAKDEPNPDHSEKVSETANLASKSSPSTKINDTYIAFSEELPDYVNAKKAYDNRNYTFAKSESERLIKYYPEEPLLYKLAALANMQFNNYDLAYQQIEMALTLNPTDFTVIMYKSIFSALQGKQSESIKYAGYLGKMVNQEWLDFSIKYMSDWQNVWAQSNPNGANLIGQSINHLKSTFSQSDHKYYDGVYRLVFIDCKGEYIATRSASSLENRFNIGVNLIYDLGLPREMMHQVMWFMYNGSLTQLSNSEISYETKQVLYDFAINYIEARLWGEQEQNRVTNPFLYCRFTDSKYRYFIEAGDFDKALALNTSRLEMAQSGTLMKFELFNLIGDRLYLLGYMNRRNEGASYAESLTKIDGQYTSPLHVTKAYGALSNYYRDSDPTKAVYYAEKQVSYMLSTGYSASISFAYNDLGSAYLSNKQNDKAVEAFIKSAENSDSEGGKGINYYNVAVQLWSFGAQNEAIEIHIKAENSMTKHLKSLDEFSRNVYYINLFKNNVLLARRYYQIGDEKSSFEAVERAKSLDLSLAIDETTKPLTLREVQQMLSPSQIMLYYSKVIDKTEDGHFLIYAITKDGITTKLIGDVKNMDEYQNLIAMRYRYKNALMEVEKEVARAELRKPSFVVESKSLNSGDFNLLTEKLRQSYKTDQEFISDDIGKAYYNAFIKPIQPSLEGKTELIIVPDGPLFYIPFEAIKDEQGKYLVENYDISYIQSPTILKSIQNRNYTDRSKSILAMGGANFNPPNLKANIIQSYNDIQRIKLKVFEDIGNGKNSMRQSWIDLGHTPMNYLPGTVQEVNTIKSTIPSTESYLGNDMSESRLKQMSSNGSLSQFKVLHFATHGWIESFLPELSGFTMTLFPDELNGEDGIIYLHEVEKLNLKADLVMLSACQTALGKEQTGKGVSGLNKSFIAAGANSTITSLWTVNDYATSILASEIYRMVFKEGKSYLKAINEVKRKFIQGDYDQDGVKMGRVSFWAPFIYYGRLN